MAFPIHTVILQLLQPVWHTPASRAPTPKRAECWYFIPSKGTDFLFTHLPPNSLVVKATIEYAHQQHFECTPQLCCQETRLDGSQGLFINSVTVLRHQLPGYSCQIQLSVLLQTGRRPRFSSTRPPAGIPDEGRLVARSCSRVGLTPQTLHLAPWHLA